MATADSLEGQTPSGARLARVMSELVTNGSIEISATSADRVPQVVRDLPFGTSVYVPSPARKPLESNLELVAALHDGKMEPVPHIAARKVTSRQELTSYLERVVNEFGVHRLLVIGGDAKEPMGPYKDSLSLLRDGLLKEAGIREIGVAGYPEGHPRIPPETLRSDLEAKVQLAADQGLGIEVITQFSFVPTRITEYCANLAHLAPNVPVYVGMAGPTNTAALIRFANYCGVSTSVRALSDMGVAAIKLMKHTDPDEQLIALAKYCAPREVCNVIGVHLFTFGGVERSAQWMKKHFL